MNEATKRLAVVIGNSDYENLTSLANPVNDAKAIKEALHSLGYEVFLGINLQRSEILKHFKNVLDTWENRAGEIVVYYSGHGISFDGNVYIGPVDADNETSAVLIKESFFGVETIINLLLEHRKDDKHPIIFILDCCRSEVMSNNTHAYSQGDPLQSSRGEFGSKTNIAILYSTADGQVALDKHDESNHSPYTQILLENIMKDLTIYEINNMITRTLGESSRFGSKQVSWMYQCLYEPYRFSPHKSSVIRQELSSSDHPVIYRFYGVPSKNYNFINRPEIIMKMESSLNEKNLSGGNILALKGLGGMGKTQLMLQYCYLHNIEYDYIFWLEADGRTMTFDSFRKLAVNLGLNEENVKEMFEEEKLMGWIRGWFEKKAKWLLLLDNVDQVMAVELFNYLPRIGGDIILTTREYIPSTKAKVINVYKMSENEALSLLLSRSLDSIDQQNEKYAKEIVTELDSMPLAIVLACGYIDSMQISFKSYLSTLKNQRDDVFSHSDEDNSHQYNHTITTVWRISFERVRTHNHIAGMILDICSFLQPDSIPVRLFEQYSSLTHGLTLPLFSSSPESSEYSWKTVRGAISVLVKFSFVMRTTNETVGGEEEYLIIHRLIQKVILNAMSDEKKIRLANNLATTLNNETQFSDSYAITTRNIMNTYLPHIRHFITLLAGKDSLSSIDLQALLVQTVYYLLNNGIYTDVETLAKLAVSVSESIDELSTAKSLICLARVCNDRGTYADAEALCQRSLMIREKALGFEHPDTTESVSLLAVAYKNQGKYVDAEPLYERALAITERTLGPEHLLARSLNDLALLYDHQGNYAKAEPLYQRSLAISEKVLGPEHPDMARSLNNLALLYNNQGNYAKAEPLYQRSLAISEKVLGPEHPNTATSLDNLALLYNHQGNYAKAEPLYQRALAIREKVLGPEHPNTATSLNNLASLYDSQGNYTKAEPLYQRALAIREKVLGPEHPDTATSLNNLALLYKHQGNYAKAEPLYQRDLAISEKVLGPEHPNTATSLNNLASLYNSQGNYAKAEPLYQRALAIREKVLGPEHPETAISLNNLAGLYCNQGKHADAEPMLQRALVIREKILGPEHPDTAGSLIWLAFLYQEHGRYTDAELLYQRGLTIREKVLGPDHPNTISSRNLLSSLHNEQAQKQKLQPHGILFRLSKKLEKFKLNPKP